MYAAGGFGTITAAGAVGGPGNTSHENYDGTTWTNKTGSNSGHLGGGGAGTQTSALIFGGNPTSTADTEEWNGSSWAEQNNLGTARSMISSANSGTQTAALAFGGETNPGGTIRGNTEEYDGSSWSEQNDLSTVRYTAAGAGTQTAGIVAGGKSPSFCCASFRIDEHPSCLENHSSYNLSCSNFL